MSDTAIRVENLVKVYRPRGTAEIRAVDDLTFSVERGSIFGLLGPNGAARSPTVHTNARWTS